MVVMVIIPCIFIICFLIIKLISRNFIHFMFAVWQILYLTSYLLNFIIRHSKLFLIEKQKKRKFCLEYVEFWDKYVRKKVGVVLNYRALPFDHLSYIWDFKPLKLNIIVPMCSWIKIQKRNSHFVHKN